MKKKKYITNDNLKNSLKIAFVNQYDKKNSYVTGYKTSQYS